MRRFREFNARRAVALSSATSERMSGSEVYVSFNVAAPPVGATKEVLEAHVIEATEDAEARGRRGAGARARSFISWRGSIAEPRARRSQVSSSWQSTSNACTSSTRRPARGARSGSRQCLIPGATRALRFGDHVQEEEMTELATPPTGQREATHPHQPLDSAARAVAGRVRPCTEPGATTPRSGERAVGRGRSRDGGGGRRRGGRREGRRSLAWRDDVAREARRSCCSAIRELVHERARGDRAASSRPSTARCSPTRWARCTRGLEVIEFACGIPTLLKGELLRAGLDRGRRLLDPPAARRRRRDHAVQLPGDGARCGCGRRRSRAATRSC